MANKSTTTESENAPIQYQVERQGAAGAPLSGRFPKVIGGTCEFCGVIDRNQPAEMQYKLCPHFRGLDLRCSYCPSTKDPVAVIGHSKLNVATHPDNPKKLIVWCNSYECSKAHTERFATAKN